MIVFDLKCEDNHVFEAWFRSSDAYELQVEDGQIECPFCGSTCVTKSLMSPNIAVKSNSSSQKIPDFVPGSMGDHLVAASANVPETMEASAEDVKRALEH
ncbi:MAG: DUF1178 family protein, partial [Emcibacter sp.]|nr:DUF1178 family protein [Emcibacter sp.]